MYVHVKSSWTKYYWEPTWARNVQGTSSHSS